MQNTPSQPSSSTNPLKDLLLLFSIPIAIIIVAAGVVYVPRLLANPAYDFIYVVCDDYRCKNSYSLDGEGRVTDNADDSKESSYYSQTAYLRYYDASDGATRSVTLEEARTYQLNASSKSPDGYTLTSERSGGGFLFWGDRDSGWYLQDGAKKKKIELSTEQSYYSQDVKFLGWVNQ